MSGQTVDKDSYLAIWRALFRELLGWSNAETTAWAAHWSSLDDPNDIFYHETPQYWAVDALIPPGLKERISHADWLTLQRRIKHLLATGESRSSPLTADWRPYREQIAAILAEYGAVLPATVTH